MSHTPDDLDPARGIVYAVGLSIIFLSVVAIFAYLLTR